MFTNSDFLHEMKERKFSIRMVDMTKVKGEKDDLEEFLKLFIMSSFFLSQFEFFRVLKMKRTSRQEQAKKNFHFDTEAERENAIQANLVSNSMAWLFVDKELILLSLNSTKWPEKLKTSQKLSMIEGQSYDLRRKAEIYPYRLLTKGNLKYVERAMLSYQAEMDSGKRPSDLKTLILTASKAPLVEEVDFLSSSRAPNMTSTAITLGKEKGESQEVEGKLKSATSGQPKPDS